MTKYFRITGYYPQSDFSFIMDCNGMFDKLWQFSSFLISKGFKILEASTDETFKDVDKISKIDIDNKHLYLRAIQDGKPIYKEINKDGITFKTVTIDDTTYIPE